MFLYCFFCFNLTTEKFFNKFYESKSILICLSENNRQIDSTYTLIVHERAFNWFYWSSAIHSINWLISNCKRQKKSQINIAIRKVMGALWEYIITYETVWPAWKNVKEDRIVNKANKILCTYKYIYEHITARAFARYLFSGAERTRPRSGTVITAAAHNCENDWISILPWSARQMARRRDVADLCHTTSATINSSGVLVAASSLSGALSGRLRFWNDFDSHSIRTITQTWIRAKHWLREKRQWVTGRGL